MSRIGRKPVVAVSYTHLDVYKRQIFAITPNEYAVHAVVKNYLANQRQGTQSAKTRGEVTDMETKFHISPHKEEFEVGIERFEVEVVTSGHQAAGTILST